MRDPPLSSSRLIDMRNLLRFPDMERIGVEELNRDTVAVLARVRGGETIEITNGGSAVARLVPVDENRSTLVRLVESGRAVGPTTAGPLPLPPELGGRTVDTADDLATTRNEERW
jgi:prevent-host-death family protein